MGSDADQAASGNTERPRANPRGEVPFAALQLDYQVTQDLVKALTVNRRGSPVLQGGEEAPRSRGNRLGSRRMFR